ncbi:MAG: 4-hydroxy-3-methylbut-2-enyl diphosphate reductase [Clostridia bacterium]|nr:4-hydroxy-3-methylbut-2-enyl diphosphate reductase [Clostridia bacterium]
MSKLIVSQFKGVCNSVESAIKKAFSVETKQKAYTLGPIAHNSGVVKSLEEKGVFVTDSIENLSCGDTIVISAHGCKKSDYELAKNKGVKIVDATCPSILKIHEEVENYAHKGYHLIMIGDKNHREVKGTISFSESYTIIGQNDEINIPTCYDKYLIVAQTTFPKERYDLIAKKIENLLINLSKIVVILNTICYTTIRRQVEAHELSKSADLVLVVGDRQSANVNRLFEIAKSYTNNAYIIENVNDLKSVAKYNITMPTILTGASTPKELVMEVINIMEQNINTVDVNEVEVKTEAVVTAEPEVKTEKKEVEITTMEEALKKYAPKSYREGMTVKATIQSIDPTGVTVFVSLNGKNDSGFIASDEMELDGSYDMSKYAIGDNLQAIIIPKTDAKLKAINLSKKKYDEILVADEAVKAIKDGEEFTLTIQSAIKGGLLGKIGSYSIFVPASQIRIGYVKNLEEYVGKKLRLRILPPKAEEGEETRKANPKRIVASQRIILEEEKVAKEDSFWNAMQVNNIVEGKVKRFAKKDDKYFGIFVSIMNKDCLLHISDLSWTKVEDPSTVLELNKKYEFVVLKADRDSDKVSLGYKQLQKQPYEIAAEKYHVGDVVKGKVERIKEFGAFISIEPGIDGLVHVSEICHKWISNANEALKVGDEVEAKIVSFEKNKITLSIKALIEAPVEEVVEEVEGEEKAKSSRTDRFNKRAAKAEDKGEGKKARKEKVEDDEPHEYVSSTTGATMADLFKGLDLAKFADDNDAE